MKDFKLRVWLLLHGAKLLALILIGKIPSHFVRNFLYRLCGMKIGKNSLVYGGAEVRRPEWVEIGDGSIVGNRAILDGRLGIKIGCNVNISTGVWIWTVQHDHKDPKFGDVGGKVTVCDHAWLSCRSIILPGVTIGEGAVVAAGAVVVKDVEAYSVVAGIPAKKIADRPRTIAYNLGSSYGIPFI